MQPPFQPQHNQSLKLQCPPKKKIKGGKYICLQFTPTLELPPSFCSGRAASAPGGGEQGEVAGSCFSSLGCLGGGEGRAGPLTTEKRRKALLASGGNWQERCGGGQGGCWAYPTEERGDCCTSLWRGGCCLPPRLGGGNS